MKNSIVFALLFIVGMFSLQILHAENNKETSLVEPPAFQFEDYTSEEEWSSISREEAGSHSLGDVIAKKVCLVKKLYISQDEVAPGTPGVRVFIRKPGIYQAYNKLEKHYKKGIRKNTILLQEAQSNFNHVLDVVIALHMHETEDFELALKKAKSVEDQMEIFKKTRLTAY
jgi:hypothetical protein